MIYIEVHHINNYRNRYVRSQIRVRFPFGLNYRERCPVVPYQIPPWSRVVRRCWYDRDDGVDGARAAQASLGCTCSDALHLLEAKDGLRLYARFEVTPIQLDSTYASRSARIRSQLIVQVGWMEIMLAFGVALAGAYLDVVQA